MPRAFDENPEHLVTAWLGKDFSCDYLKQRLGSGLLFPSVKQGLLKAQD